MNQLKRFIQEHGVEAMIVDGKLRVLDVYTKNGQEFAEWVEIEATLEAARDFLGY